MNERTQEAWQVLAEAVIAKARAMRYALLNVADMNKLVYAIAEFDEALEALDKHDGTEPSAPERQPRRHASWDDVDAELAWQQGWKQQP